MAFFNLSKSYFSELMASLKFYFFFSNLTAIVTHFTI